MPAFGGLCWAFCVGIYSISFINYYGAISSTIPIAQNDGRHKWNQYIQQVPQHTIDITKLLATWWFLRIMMRMMMTISHHPPHHHHTHYDHHLSSIITIIFLIIWFAQFCHNLSAILEKHLGSLPGHPWGMLAWIKLLSSTPGPARPSLI